MTYDVDKTDDLAGMKSQEALGMQLAASDLTRGHVSDPVSSSALTSCWPSATAPAGDANDGPQLLPEMRRAALPSAAAAAALTAPPDSGVSATPSADLMMG